MIESIESTLAELKRQGPPTKSDAPAAATAGASNEQRKTDAPNDRPATVAQPSGLIRPLLKNIPAELRAQPRWAPWRAEWNEKRGKWAKIPCRANGHGLSTAKPDRWLTFDAAAKAYQAQPETFAGVGYCMTGPHGLVGIDLDGCIEPGGTLAPWAEEVVFQAQSYAEISPSGRGLRIFVMGEAGRDWTNHDQGIEVYAGHAGRFLTVTGKTLPGRDQVRAARSEWLEELAARFAKPEAGKPTQVDMPELLDELALPDLAECGLPIPAAAFLGTGEHRGDRSGELFAAAVALFSAGLDCETVLSVLAYNPHAMAVALDHRRQDHERAMEYLWKEHVQKAQARATPKVASLDDFEDVSASVPPRSPHAWTRFMELQAVPEAPRFVVPHFIEEGVVVIAGAPGVGKTTTLLPLALTVAGLHREGEPLAPQHWRHICYLTEAPGQVTQLLAAAARAPDLDISFEQIAERIHVAPLRRIAPAEAAKAGEFFAADFTRCVGNAVIPPLVVIDTQAAALALENENANSEVSAAMAAFKQGFVGLPVWFVCHTAKAQYDASDPKALTARGGGSWGADAQQTLFMVEDCGRHYLRRGKTRFEARWPELEITTDLVSVSMRQPDGAVTDHPVRWARLAPVGAAQGAADRKDDTMRIALGLVAGQQDAGNPVSTAKAGPGNCGQRLRGLSKTLERMQSGVVHDLLAEAEARGLVAQEQHRTAGRRDCAVWTVTEAGRTFLETL